jgi:hypothetical protein
MLWFTVSSKVFPLVFGFKRCWFMEISTKWLQRRLWLQKPRLLRSPVPRATRYLSYRSLRRQPRLVHQEAPELELATITPKAIAHTVTGFVSPARNWGILLEIALRSTKTTELLGLRETGKGPWYRQLRDPLNFSRRENKNVCRAQL